MCPLGRGLQAPGSQAKRSRRRSEPREKLEERKSPPLRRNDKHECDEYVICADAIRTSEQLEVGTGEQCDKYLCVCG